MDKEIVLKPVAHVVNSRKEISDDYWGGVVSEIELADWLPVESLDGIESFSHLEIIFYIDRSGKTITGSEYPRENPNWPKYGISAQRKKDRPNHLGLTTVKLIKKEGRKLFVSRLDAIDGTPVLDIKPVFEEFMAKGEIVQPEWTRELMREYWNE